MGVRRALITEFETNAANHFVSVVMYCKVVVETLEWIWRLEVDPYRNHVFTLEIRSPPGVMSVRDNFTSLSPWIEIHTVVYVHLLTLKELYNIYKRHTTR